MPNLSNPPRPERCADFPSMTLSEMFQRAGAESNVDPLLLNAIAQTESSLGQNMPMTGPSYGIMQINLPGGKAPAWLANVARQLGITAPLTPEYLTTHCLDNIRIGARILQGNLNSTRRDYALALARYNVGSGVNHPIPPLVGAQNPLAYVMKISAAYKALGGDISGWQIP